MLTQDYLSIPRRLIVELGDNPLALAEHATQGLRQEKLVKPPNSRAQFLFNLGDVSKRAVGLTGAFGKVDNLSTEELHQTVHTIGVPRTYVKDVAFNIRLPEASYI